MDVSEVTLPLEADAAVLRCAACGSMGTATSPVGDVMDRIREFADAHRRPCLVRVHLLHAQTRAPLGWLDI